MASKNEGVLTALRSFWVGYLGYQVACDNRVLIGISSLCVGALYGLKLAHHDDLR